MRELKIVGNRKIVALDYQGEPSVASIPVDVQGIAGIRHLRPLSGQNEKEAAKDIEAEINPKKSKAANNQQSKTKTDANN